MKRLLSLVFLSLLLFALCSCSETKRSISQTAILTPQVSVTNTPDTDIRELDSMMRSINPDELTEDKLKDVEK
ncbi:MAG: hypothetical protein WCP97_07220 [bacterium]